MQLLSPSNGHRQRRKLLETKNKKKQKKNKKKTKNNKKIFLPFKKCLKEYNLDPLIEKNAEDANSCELANIGL
jgi:hypothetical protein